MRSDLDRAVTRLSLVKFFPSSAEAMGAMREFLLLICPHKESLEWLVFELVNKVGEWPGAADVRGLLSVKYMPADGLRTDCGIPGYRPQDFETAEIDRHYTRVMGGIPAGDMKRIEGKRLADIAPLLLEKGMK
jgi:hypothetical protein